MKKSLLSLAMALGIGLFASCSQGLFLEMKTVWRL